MKTQNKNFLYNVVYQVFVFIVPMLTTPYISRVLGVDNIGVYSYTYSIVNYFMLLSMLGINNYGAREIAKCKTKEETSRMFKSIYLLQFVLNVLCVCAYFVMIAFIDYKHKGIMFIQGIFLISVSFDINWFFFGKEKFKITITRNIIIKLISLAFIFAFVKRNEDLWKYVLIMSVSTLFSQMYLWFFLSKNVNLRVHIEKQDILQHIKPCLILFVPVISYSIYRVMDKTMLGAIANTMELGNYESAEKIINIPIGFVTAIGTVMLPHMSKKSLNEIKESIYSTFELTFFIVLPMIVGLFIVAQDFSSLFFGKGFEKTGNIIRVLVVTIFFSSVANVVRTNLLIPQKKDNIYVKSTIYGAIINLIANTIFIYRFGAYGACIGTVLAEFILMFYQVWKTRTYISYKRVGKILFSYLLKSFFVGIVIAIIGLFVGNVFVKIFIQVFVAVVIYVILNRKYIISEFWGKSGEKIETI